MNTRGFLPVTQLLPGQSLRVAVDADTSLLVLEGRIGVVSPPSWFGETVFSVKNEYQEGEVFEAGRGGWIEVRARTAARVQGIPQAVPEVRPRGSRVARLVQLLLPS